MQNPARCCGGPTLAAWARGRHPSSRGSVEPVAVTLRKIVRISDGVEISGTRLSVDVSELTPVVEDGIVYHSSRFRDWKQLFSVIAVKLPRTAAGDTKTEVLWDPPGDDLHMPVRGGNFIVASPLVADGILYSVDIGGGIFAADMGGQKGLYRRWLDGYNRYNRSVYGVAASPTLAGKHIYVTDDAGYTHLVEPGLEVPRSRAKRDREHQHLRPGRQSVQAGIILHLAIFRRQSHVLARRGLPLLYRRKIGRGTVLSSMRV
jgi:hypothetical protein